MTGLRSRINPLSVGVVLLAVTSAGLAVLASQVLFPDLSINNDEPIYRLQAQAIADGHLFPEAGGMPDAFRPWLAAVNDGHYVLKYPPFFPALVAVGLLLTGGTAPVLAGIAAAAVAMTYALAQEVSGRGWEASTAAAVVALSPLSLVLNALLLPYMTTFVLLEVVAWGLIRGTKTTSLRPLAVAGLAFGWAFAIRPYDALLFSAPLVFLLLRKVPGSRRRRSALAFGSPGLVGVAAFLFSNQAMTGNPLRPPFALLEPADSLGFGTRKLFPTDLEHHFGPFEGLRGAFEHAWLLNRWVAGGTILIVLALVGLARSRSGDPIRWLAASAAMIPVGYLVFWGPWNATVLWGGTRWVGPFYFLPVLIALGPLGARGLAVLRGRSRWTTYPLVAAMIGVTLAAAVPIAVGNRAHSEHSEALINLLDRPPAPASKLIFVEASKPFLMHPSAVVANRWNLAGPTLFAIHRNPEQDVEVALAHPDRTPYRLELVADSVDPDGPFSARLSELRLGGPDGRELLATGHSWVADA